LNGRQIAARDWRVTCAFAGQDAFSAGDLLMVTVLRRLSGSGILEEYPNLSAYVARGEARPAYKRVFDDQLAVFTAASPG
jgi:glutathione S-transferase